MSESFPDRVQPIRPEDIGERKLEIIPEEVLEIFNRLIVEKIGEGSAVLRQDDVVKELVDSGLDRDEVFDRGWLDVERVYREAGWEVIYDKPGFNETYPATFTFRTPRKS